MLQHAASKALSPASPHLTHTTSSCRLLTGTARSLRTLKRTQRSLVANATISEDQSSAQKPLSLADIIAFEVRFSCSAWTIIATYIVQWAAREAHAGRGEGSELLELPC